MRELDPTISLAGNGEAVMCSGEAEAELLNERDNEILPRLLPSSAGWSLEPKLPAALQPVATCPQNNAQ
jgi:hypothetical protein